MSTTPTAKTPSAAQTGSALGTIQQQRGETTLAGCPPETVQVYRCRWIVSHALPVPECGQPATHYDPATGACFCARHEQHYRLANGIRSLRALPPAPAVDLTPESLMAKWLDRVNQPVVNDAADRIRQLLDVVSDNDNFTPEQSRAILCSLVQTVAQKR